MRPRSRLIRALLIVLAVLGIAGYGAFSTYVFNPLEGGLGVDVAGLIDRDVDFFVARAELGRTIDGFPHLAFEDELAAHPTWQVFASSPEKEKLFAELGVEEAVRELEALAGRFPLGLEPQDLFGGRDLAVAGHFAGPRMDQADWALYGTLNWAGKLAIEMLRYPGLIGLEDQGVSADVQDDWVRLSGGQLQRELFVARIRDVGIVATRVEPIQEALERQEKQFEDSMLLRAEYGDHVLVEGRSPRMDEFEVWIDFRDLFENFQYSGAWPDPKGESFLPALLARFFQANLLNYVIGTVGIDEGLTLDLRGQLSSELMTPLQERAYYRSTADRREIRDEAAFLAPADSALFLYVRADVGDFLRQVLEAMDQNTRELLGDAFRQTGKYTNLDQVVDLLDACLRDRFAFIVRRNDYAEDPQGPPHDDRTVPAIALVTWIRDGKKEDLEALRDTIGWNPQIFGLKGREENEPGYYKNIEGGYETREFWNELIPGTGVVATANAAGQCIVTNSHPMLSHVILTYTTGAPSYPRLSERGDFEGLLSSSMPQATVLAWIDPRALGDTLRKMARRWAEDSIFIDWAAERAKAERDVVAKSFPDHVADLQRGRLPDDVRMQVDAQVEPILAERQRAIFETQVPAIEAGYVRNIEYAEAVSAALVMLALDPKHIDLSARIVAPFPE